MRQGKLATFLVSAALMVSMAAAAPGQAETIFAIQDGVNSGGVYTIDSTTGTLTQIGQLGVSVGNCCGFNSLALSSSGTMYTMNQSDGAHHLYTVDQTTGAVTLVAPSIIPASDRHDGLAIDGSGNMFAISRSGDLRSLNLATGTSTLIGNVGIPNIGSSGGQFIQSLDFSPSGTLYTYSADNTGAGGLYTIDPLTASATRIGPGNSGVVGITSLSFASDGTLWASRCCGLGTRGLYTVDLTSGALTRQVGGFIGSGFPSGIQGIEFLPTPVPVPAAIWLFGSGLAAMVGLARKKYREASFVKRSINE